MTLARNPARRAHRRTPLPPAAKRLSQRELRDLLRRLDLREELLTAKIAEERRRIDDEGLSQLEDDVGDQVDQAFVKTSVEMERGLVDRYTAELAEIAVARERLADNVYGLCTDCGEPIGAARLDAQPTARRCADCQWRYEKVVDIVGGALSSG
ncbi:MAG TPA: TraR/DksA family transcriptional regulator [Casimicrobiaceae bacterium]